LVSKNINVKIYSTTILSVFVYGCETWWLTLREERWVSVIKNRVLRRIFGPKRSEVKVEWRKLHNEELDNLYCSPNIIRVVKDRRMKWVGHVARMRDRRGIYGVLVGKSEGKRPLVSTKRIWEDNIKMGLQKVRWGGGGQGLG
jgi:hypothetical protein